MRPTWSTYHLQAAQTLTQTTAKIPNSSLSLLDRSAVAHLYTRSLLTDKIGLSVNLVKDAGVCFLPASILSGSLPGRPLSSIPTCGLLSGVAAQLTQEAMISAHPRPTLALSVGSIQLPVCGVGVMGPE